VAFEDEGDFPGEVEGVLDAGVGAEAVEGRMSVDGVAKTEAGSVSVVELACSEWGEGRACCRLNIARR